MKVSIITSCYNREATIRGAIESVLAQDYPDIEYIVVDGASSDGSVGIIRNEELKVKSEEFATATGWYTLDGRRIEGQPTQRSAEGRLFPQGLKKGVYIVNGKKKVIK